MSRLSLILETGGTRSRYAFLSEEGTLVHSGTARAFNPNIHKCSVLSNITRPILDSRQNIQYVSVFIAGFNDSYEEDIRSELSRDFPDVNFVLHSDLEAIGTILSPGTRSWIGILGTGSSFALWDGQQIEQHIPGFGYILGDEGSGRHMAKQVVTAYYRNQLSPALNKMLEPILPYSYDELIQLIYQDLKWPQLSSQIMEFLQPF